MFILTEQQRALRQELRDFVDTELLPRAMEIDATGQPPRDIMKKIAQRGYCSAAFSKKLGGGGGGALEGLMFIEEISRGLASLGFVYTANTFQICYALKDAVTRKQAEQWLIPAIRGEKILTLALSEELGGSDAFAIATSAEKRGGEWVLNGSKYWITNAGIADGYIVAARTADSTRSRDVILFYVDARTPGVDDNHRVDMAGLASSPTGSIRFNDCHIPADCLIGSLGTEQSSYHLIQRALLTGRISLAAVSA